MRSGGKAGDVDDVLDADRDAVQRAADASAEDFSFGLNSRLHRGVCVQANERMQFAVEHLDPSQQALQNFDRRKLLCRKCVRKFGCRQPMQRGHRPMPARIGGQGSAAGSVGTWMTPAFLSAC